MKYYYGHSIKEAVSHPAIEIRDLKILAQYQELYNVVIPVRDDEEEEE